MFLEGGGELSVHLSVLPLTPSYGRIRLCIKILVIIEVFRPFQANAFDYVQGDPGHSKEKRGNRLRGGGELSV